jgi:predicted TIM-barrel fold metal-dependent hydrolase
VWGVLSDAVVPVVIHVGSGPVPRAGFTGPDKLEGVLRRHPLLTAVVAHLGAPEYAEFLTLAERYPRVHLDTTMTFTDFFEVAAPFPPDLLPRLAAIPDRIVLGSDFPNIPYPYIRQLEALERLRQREPALDDEWLRAVCWFNGQRLIGP